MTGTKRASPGGDDAKDLVQVELSEEDSQKLVAIQRELQRAELAIELESQAKLRPVYEKRREVLKSIPKFWPVALLNNSLFMFHAQHSADQSALMYLEDVWLSRDAVEPRCYTLEFHFKENPYFHDKVLTKQFAYVPPPAKEDDKPDENGITEAMLDFSWEKNAKPSAIKINWKSDDKNLTKLYPREKVEDEDDDEPAEAGSFFNFFEVANDPFEIGVTIANEIFAEAIEWFSGQAGGEEDSDSDEDSDDDAEEIDLEKPSKKKQKV